MARDNRLLRAEDDGRADCPRFVAQYKLHTHEILHWSAIFYTLLPVPDEQLGLRERKRLATRAALGQAAWRLTRLSGCL